MNKKIILIIVAVITIIIAGVKVRNYQGYPRTSNFPFYPIHEINANKFNSGKYNTEGYVSSISHCSRCFLYISGIVISENNQIIDSTKDLPLTDYEISLGIINNPDNLKLGEKIKFSIEINKYGSAQIIGYDLSMRKNFLSIINVLFSYLFKINLQ